MSKGEPGLGSGGHEDSDADAPRVISMFPEGEVPPEPVDDSVEEGEPGEPGARLSVEQGKLEADYQDFRLQLEQCLPLPHYELDELNAATDQCRLADSAADITEANEAIDRYRSHGELALVAVERMQLEHLRSVARRVFFLVQQGELAEANDHISEALHSTGSLFHSDFCRVLASAETGDCSLIDTDDTCMFVPAGTVVESGNPLSRMYEAADQFDAGRLELALQLFDGAHSELLQGITVQSVAVLEVIGKYVSALLVAGRVGEANAVVEDAILFFGPAYRDDFMRAMAGLEDEDYDFCISDVGAEFVPTAKAASQPSVIQIVESDDPEYYREITRRISEAVDLGEPGAVGELLSSAFLGLQAQLRQLETELFAIAIELADTLAKQGKRLDAHHAIADLLHVIKPANHQQILHYLDEHYPLLPEVKIAPDSTEREEQQGEVEPLVDSWDYDPLIGLARAADFLGDFDRAVQYYKAAQSETKEELLLFQQLLVNFASAYIVALSSREDHQNIADEILRAAKQAVGIRFHAAIEQLRQLPTPTLQLVSEEVGGEPAAAETEPQ